MTISEQDPQEVQPRLAQGGCVYLDVRTEREFEQGHPPGALNVPVVFIDRPGAPPRPNPDFLDVVRAVVSPDAELIVGCQSGVRSRRACEILSEAGYRVTNVRGGFGGARDRSGRIVAKGWCDCDLPVEEGQPPERRYADLRAKADLTKN